MRTQCSPDCIDLSRSQHSQHSIAVETSQTHMRGLLSADDGVFTVASTDKCEQRSHGYNDKHDYNDDQKKGREEGIRDKSGLHNRTVNSDPSSCAALGATIGVWVRCLC
jgi:hypothetical protein